MFHLWAGQVGVHFRKILDRNKPFLCTGSEEEFAGTSETGIVFQGGIDKDISVDEHPFNSALSWLFR